MSKLEILALIFSIIILIKTAIFLFTGNLFKTRLFHKYSTFIEKYYFIALAFYSILLIMVGRIIFKEFSKIEIAAVALFVSMMMSISLLPLSSAQSKIAEEIINNNINVEFNAF